MFTSLASTLQYRCIPWAPCPSVPYLYDGVQKQYDHSADLHLPLRKVISHGHFKQQGRRGLLVPEFSLNGVQREREWPPYP